MMSILSLGRSRVGALFAWLAILSLGALGVAHDARAFDGVDKVSAVRTLVEAPAHVGRAAAVKLTSWHRADDDDRRTGSGPDPLMLGPVVFVLVERATGAPAFAAKPLAQAAGWHGAPYAARAPPRLSIR